MRIKAEGYIAAAGGVVAGAAVMYLLDPSGGRRRRSLAKDRARHAAHEMADAVDVTAKDVAHRTRGVFSELFSRLRAEEVEDRVLVERVRSKLGRVCSHPGAIIVEARDGRVELKGPILRHEHKHVLSAIAHVRGVTSVDDDLEVYETAENIPSLQGGVAVQGERFGPMQELWSPTTRLVMGSVGAGLLIWSLSHRGLPGLLLGTAGGTVLLRSLTNLQVKRMVGVGAGHRAIELLKTINVQAPVQEVFSFWQSFENFPRFMTHVREVRRTSDGRYHWRVEGPAGAPFEWDAEITQLVPDKLLAWKSVGNPAVENAGLIRFEELPDGGTRMTVHLSYNPPGGAIGHAFAKLLGANPKKQMDDDLLRFKSLMEVGKATGEGAQVRREELSPKPGQEPLPR